MTENEKCLMQNVVIVEMIAKYHSNLEKVDLFIAENASKIINQNHEVVVADLEEIEVIDLAVMEEIEILDLVGVQEMTDHEKCLMQNAETVEMIAKYHSNLEKTDLFIAENVSKITEINIFNNS